MTAAPHAPRRILVAGVSGVGKTTLCREIERRSGIPHTEIGALFHGPGWTPRPEFAADVARLAETAPRLRVVRLRHPREARAWVSAVWPTGRDPKHGLRG